MSFFANMQFGDMPSVLETPVIVVDNITKTISSPYVMPHLNLERDFSPFDEDTKEAIIITIPSEDFLEDISLALAYIFNHPIDDVVRPHIEDNLSDLIRDMLRSTPLEDMSSNLQEFISSVVNKLSYSLDNNFRTAIEGISSQWGEHDRSSIGSVEKNSEALSAILDVSASEVNGPFDDGDETSGSSSEHIEDSSASSTESTAHDMDSEYLAESASENTVEDLTSQWIEEAPVTLPRSWKRLSSPALQGFVFGFPDEEDVVIEPAGLNFELISQNKLDLFSNPRLKLLHFGSSTEMKNETISFLTEQMIEDFCTAFTEKILGDISGVGARQEKDTTIIHDSALEHDRTSPAVLRPGGNKPQNPALQHLVFGCIDQINTIPDPPPNAIQKASPSSLEHKPSNIKFGSQHEKDDKAVVVTHPQHSSSNQLLKGIQFGSRKEKEAAISTVKHMSMNLLLPRIQFGSLHEDGKEEASLSKSELTFHEEGKKVASPSLGHRQTNPWLQMIHFRSFPEKDEKGLDSHLEVKLTFHDEDEMELPSPLNASPTLDEEGGKAMMFSPLKDKATRHLPRGIQFGSLHEEEVQEVALLEEDVKKVSLHDEDFKEMVFSPSKHKLTSQLLQVILFGSFHDENVTKVIVSPLKHVSTTIPLPKSIMFGSLDDNDDTTRPSEARPPKINPAHTQLHLGALENAQLSPTLPPLYHRRPAGRSRLGPANPPGSRTFFTLSANPALFGSTPASSNLSAGGTEFTSARAKWLHQANAFACHAPSQLRHEHPHQDIGECKGDNRWLGLTYGHLSEKTVKVVEGLSLFREKKMLDVSCSLAL
jgi:hypothetical protein